MYLITKKVLVWVMAIASTASAYSQKDKPVRNVVLVHGAFVDGSGWKGVYDALAQQGYNVSVTQHKLNDFAEDVAEVTRILNQQDGPCILVGHSYGGVVITQAGNHPRVAGLVYIAAHAPEVGEKRADLVKAHPSAYRSLIKGPDGWDYIDPSRFPEDFAADLPSAQAQFLANSQCPTADKVFQATVSQAAWKTRPSWYMVAKSDRIINPDLERFYARRANSTVVEADAASHAVYMSQPDKVAGLIVMATLGKKN